MKIPYLLLIMTLGLPAIFHAAEGDPSQPVQLNPSRQEVIYLQPQIVTSLTFKTKEKFGPIAMGSTIVAGRWNSGTKTLDLMPAVTEGKTSLNMTIGRQMFTFILIISTEDQPVYRRTYTLNEEESADIDMSAAASVKPMKPQDIDTVGLIKTITRAHNDATYRSTLVNYRVVPIGQVNIWNSSPVTLVEANAFADLDLIALKIEWYNASDKLLYLDAKQVEIRVAGKPIPITARQQVTNQIFPGQMDIMWLFVQGYHLSPKNNWEIRLPPDAKSVQKMLQKK